MTQNHYTVLSMPVWRRTAASAFCLIAAAAASAVIAAAITLRGVVEGITILLLPAIVAAFVFGVGFVVSAVTLFFNIPYLRIEESRLVVGLMFSQLVLPWEEVREFTCVHLGYYTTRVGYRLAQPIKHRRRVIGRISLAYSDCDGLLPSNFGLAATDLHAVLSAQLHHAHREADQSMLRHENAACKRDGSKYQ